jgi:hypothetical protein
MLTGTDNSTMFTRKRRNALSSQWTLSEAFDILNKSGKTWFEISKFLQRMKNSIENSDERSMQWRQLQENQDYIAFIAKANAENKEELDKTSDDNSSDKHALPAASLF